MYFNYLGNCEKRRKDFEEMLGLIMKLTIV